MRDIFLLSSQNISDKTVKTLQILDVNFFDKKINFSSYDAIIFTSKNAVLSCKNPPKNTKAFVVGKQTALLATRCGYVVEYTSNGYATDLIRKINENKEKNFLFISGEKISSSIDKLPNVTRIITYSTHCKALEIAKFSNAIFIFTSPFVVECFLRQQKWQESFTAIAIGKTTAKAFSADIKVHIAKTPSIKDCIKLAIKLNNFV